MGDKTGIEWTDATWNPTVGCSVVSPGCKHCYAMRVAHRLASNPEEGVHHYRGLTVATKGGPVWNGVVRAAPGGIFLKPLAWTRPRLIFVNSMSDLFHPGLFLDEYSEIVDDVFAMMALCQQHVFQVLTKRSDIMRAYLSQETLPGRVFGAVARISAKLRAAGMPALALDRVERAYRAISDWPLPNVWAGVSVEDQERTSRLIDLAYTPAAVRWVSLEPLLGPTNLRDVRFEGSQPGLSLDTLTGLWSWRMEGLERAGLGDLASSLLPPPAAPLDWLVIGGESGPGSRPMHPDWPRNIFHDRRILKTPTLFKQWGDWLPWGQRAEEKADDGRDHASHRWPDGTMAWRIGKRAAGRILDGKVWDEYPRAFASRAAA